MSIWDEPWLLYGAFFLAGYLVAHAIKIEPLTRSAEKNLRETKRLLDETDQLNALLRKTIEAHEPDAPRVH